MSHDEGASTDSTGSFVSCRARITAGKGSRTSPEKLNPNGEYYVNAHHIFAHIRNNASNSPLFDSAGKRTKDGIDNLIG